MIEKYKKYLCSIYMESFARAIYGSTMHRNGKMRFPYFSQNPMLMAFDCADTSLCRTTLHFVQKSYMFILVIFLFVHVNNLNAEELGRLFTTIDERIKLEELRQEKPIETKIIDIDIDETENVEEQEVDIGGITVNGLVYRKDGKSTAWINNSNTYQGDMSNQYLQVDAENIDPEHVQVELPAGTTKITLKAGQTYDPATAEVIDLTDNYRK